MKENSNVTDTNVGDIEEAKRIIERLISTMKSDREMFDEKTREKEIYTFFINALEFILSDYKRVLKENEEKNKIIDLMVKVMIDSSICDYFIKEKCKNYAGKNGKTCDDCIKQYFENKVKEVK